MRTTIVTAAGIVGLLALAGCRAESSGADAAGAADSTSTEAAADEAQAEAPTPIPTPEGVSVDFQANVENADGYSGKVEGSVTIPHFEVEIASSKPGFAGLVRPPAIDSTLEFTNTTEARSAPVPLRFFAFAYYPIDSPACEAYATYPAAPDHTQPDYKQDESARRLSYFYDGTYCYVDVMDAQHAAPPLPDGLLPADSTATYEASTQDSTGRHTGTATMAEVPEEQADALADSLNNPLGIILSAHGVSTNGEHYISEANCAALPTDVKAQRGFDLTLPDGFVMGAGGSLIGATGPIC